jgi:hypothetical protein
MHAYAAANGGARKKYGGIVAITREVFTGVRSMEYHPTDMDMSMSELNDSLTRQIKALQPRRLMAIGDDARRLLRSYTDATTRCELEFLETEEAAERLPSVESERRYDFALVAGYLEYVDSAKGGAVIARLRDVLAHRLCVLVGKRQEDGKQPTWSDSELSAYGLTLLGRYQEGGKQLRLYGFDIASYKQTPDWLSPRHWAHPELWGKFRW